MYKTPAKRKLKQTTRALTHDVQKMKKTIAKQVAKSINNAKEKSALLHDNVANISYNKPYTTIGFAVLTGAVIGFIVSKIND